MAIDRPENFDFSANLADMGIAFDASLSDVGVPVLDGAAVMARLAGNQPPDREMLTPLPLFSAALAKYISRPIMKASVVSDVHSLLADNVRRLVNDSRFGLNADRETADDFRLGAGEALQNGIRYGGIAEINLMRTQHGLIYFDVHNLPLDFPTNCLHLRPGQRPLRLGVRKQQTKEATHAIDEGGWGMYLIGSLATSAHGEPPAGLYDRPYLEIPVVGTDRTMFITRKVSWATYGQPDQRRRRDTLQRAA